LLRLLKIVVNSQLWNASLRFRGGNACRSLDDAWRRGRVAPAERAARSSWIQTEYELDAFCIDQSTNAFSARTSTLPGKRTRSA